MSLAEQHAFVGALVAERASSGALPSTVTSGVVVVGGGGSSAHPGAWCAHAQPQRAAATDVALPDDATCCAACMHTP